MSKPVNFSKAVIMEPSIRLKHLAIYGNTVDVDPNVPVKRYYRSGMEMVRMANVYYSEGNYESAYTLFIRFMTLFLEKIQSHPEYKTLPLNIKQSNQLKIKEILPVTEQLKLKLLEAYQKEYSQYLLFKENESRRKEAENVKQKPKDITKSTENDKPVMTDIPLGIQERSSIPSILDVGYLDSVVYPNDFPSDPSRNTQPSGLIMANSTPLKPNFDRNLKPATTSVIENELRIVVIPNNTMSNFLDLSKNNTLNNIETCGILAGKLEYNQLLITHIIIPKQKGTPDSCNTTNEEELFDYQDQHNLITLGWIHTHPTQTAFLSSVDLHTHCSYQIMMPEALAIVCAPKYQTTGFYCLTPNFGLDFIAQCRQTGFHPHPNDPPLFMDAKHILLNNNNKICVVDLRK